VVRKTDQWWPTDLPLSGSAGLAIAGLVSSVGWLLFLRGHGEADGIAADLADVGVVQQPVHGGRGEGFAHELIEPRRGWRYVFSDRQFVSVKCTPI
jgi:hypothetical protein